MNRSVKLGTHWAFKCVYLNAYDLRLSAFILMRILCIYSEDIIFFIIRKSKEKRRKRCIMINSEMELEELEDLFLYFYHRYKHNCKYKLKNKKRRFWVRKIYQQRQTHGVFNTLYQELKDDREYHYRYIRMSPDRFKHLLSLVE